MTKEKIEKTFPSVGEHLYLYQKTGNKWVDMVKEPATVIEVTPTKVVIQRCKLIFKGPVYYNTLADDIQENTEGEIWELHWYPSKGLWGFDKYKTGYPEFAKFGEWIYQPYLN